MPSLLLACRPSACGRRMRVAAAARSFARLSPAAPRFAAPRARPLHAPPPALRRAAHASASAGMDAMERYFFDLNGFIVVPQVFTADEVAACNAAIDAREAAFKERTGALRLGGQAGDPLSGDGATGREDLGGVLGWRDVAGEHGGPFRQMLCHPRLMPYYEALCGRGYRLDHSPFVLQQRSGAEGFVLHGGATGDDGRPDWELAYGCVNGAMRCNLLAASLQLVDTAPGDGGFVLLRGSHKAAFPCPQAVKELKAGAEHGATPAMRAGDVLLFTEAATHGTLPWRRPDTRRVALYRFAPAAGAYGRGYLREGGADVAPGAAWPETFRQGLTPAQAAVLQPPFHTRLDRTTPAADGVATVVPEPRAGFKKDFDHGVFGTTYF